MYTPEFFYMVIYPDFVPACYIGPNNYTTAKCGDHAVVKMDYRHTGWNETCSIEHGVQKVGFASFDTNTKQPKRLCDVKYPSESPSAGVRLTTSMKMAAVGSLLVALVSTM